MQSQYDTFGDFMGQWCRQEDVDPSVIETIAAAEMTEFDQKDGSVQKKIVLHFRNGTKPLPLNPTNRDTMMAMFDLTSKSKLDTVVGRKIRIYRDPTVTMGGQKVGGVRICDPSEDPTRKWRRPQSHTSHPEVEDDGSIETITNEKWAEGRE